MLKTLKLLLFSIALALTPFIVVTVVFAENSSDSDVSDIQKKIDNYEKKVSELQGKAKTLANEIETMDDQISLTELRIQNSTEKIKKTETDISKIADNISELSTRIDKLQTSIDYQRKVLAARLRERYETRETSPVMIVFGADTLTTLIQKTEYLRVMELQDNKLMTEMSKTKSNYNNQKDLLEREKAEEEQLKKQLITEKGNLDAYKSTLEDQQVEKQHLLQITQNDEAKYQGLLADAQRELNQILGAVTVLKNKEAKDVKKGEAIGIQGSTGNSTGPHLHFGVYKYSSFSEIDGWNWYYSNYVNPGDKLKSRSIYWDTGCETPGNRTVGKGSWEWPMKNAEITQGFGYTCWSKKFYGGNPHPAYDMAGPLNSTVYAAEAGKAYFCRNCLGDGGNGVFIFHKGGYMTLYWHLQ